LTKLSVAFFEEALVEVEHERTWYEARSVAAGAGFMRELEQAIGAIAEHPERWPRRGRRVRRYVFPTYPFSFIYVVESSAVFVVALEPQRRRPGYWRSRLR